MRRLALAVLGILVLTAGCKTPSGESAATSVENDTDAVIRQPQSGLFQVFCRKGRAHPCKDDRGTPQLINGEPVLCTMTYVPKNELSTVCELPDPGGNQGGGGGGGSQGPDLATCANVPEKVKALNIAFSTAYIQQAAQLSPALAKQQLCVGVVTGLKNMVEASQSLFRFLTGETSDSPVLVIIDRKDAAVAYDGESFALTLPSKMTEQTRGKVEDALAAEGVFFCPTGGKKFGGACWFLGSFNQNCNDVCTGVSASYDERTATWAGSAGTDANCSTLATAFGMTFDSYQFWPQYPMGCAVNSSGRVYRAVESYTSPQFATPSFRLFCACK